MKRNFIFAYLIFVSSICIGQTINVSKDTLNYFLIDHPNPYDIYDSLYIYNFSEIPLEIDSIYNKNNFHYKLIYKHNEIIEKNDHINSSLIYPIIISPNDSGKFIFEFELPLIKINLSNNLWSDSLYIENNSQNNPKYILSVFNDIPLSINERNEVIKEDFQLFQNYPNPFNPITTIGFTIPKHTKVTMKVYDILGNELKTLLNEEKGIGNYKLEFDGSKLPSGIYFYKMQTFEFSETKKLLLLK